MRAKNNQLTHFSLHLEQMHQVASFVVDVITDNYPDLHIPYHSRWRHFEAGNVPRIEEMSTHLHDLSGLEKGKILYELVIISVLLDAGAGPMWRYHEKATNSTFTRSEGLAVASLSLYQSGIFSQDNANPLRIDAEKLIELTEQDLAEGFQVTQDNPLTGLLGRTRLMNQLGHTLQKKPTIFGHEARLGNFYPYIVAQAINQELSANQLFDSVLHAFNDIWPTRLTYHGVSLGDVWHYPPCKTDKTGSDLIPFHKLSQWLTYSLIEPLEQAAIKVTNLDELTGLPEYRNGGLFFDFGVICLKDKAMANNAHEPGSELIVEWRALTVALLDELAYLIRQMLHQTQETLPLAKILQGGTWEAGRKIALQKRPAGIPPLQIISDGTVF